jgi:hypothetical protein
MLCPRSQKHLPTKRAVVIATLAAAVAAAAVLATAAEQNNGNSHGALAATVGPTAKIGVVTATKAQHVHSRQEHGWHRLLATCALCH